MHMHKTLLTLWHPFLHELSYLCSCITLFCAAVRYASTYSNARNLSIRMTMD